MQGFSIEDYSLVNADGFTSGIMGGHAGSFVISYDYEFKHVSPDAIAPHLQDVAPRKEEVSPVNIDPDFCGAQDVGICTFDRRWVYNPRWNTDTNYADIPGD